MNLQLPEIEAGSRSDVGKVREENQDCMTEASVPLGRIFIVADGMGGHKGGAYAAKLVVQGLLRHLQNAAADANVEEVLTAAFGDVNDTVYAEGHGGDPAIEKMGSTAVLLLVSGSTAQVAHVGDSRAYLYRDGILQQLTKDHTVVQRMVDAGMLKPEEAASHPDASVLERAIGSEPAVKVDIGAGIPLSDGDAILLCSDGLYGYVKREHIESVLHSDATAQEIADHLVKQALQNGGGDNITVQYIRYGSRKAATATLTAEGAEPAARATAILPAVDAERATQAVEERGAAAPEPASGPAPAATRPVTHGGREEEKTAAAPDSRSTAPAAAPPAVNGERATRAVEQRNAETPRSRLSQKMVLALLALCLLAAGVLAYCAAARAGQEATTGTESPQGERLR